MTQNCDPCKNAPNKYVRLRGPTYIHTCRSYVHTPRELDKYAAESPTRGPALAKAGSVFARSLLRLLIHHSAHPLLPLSFTPGLKHICFTNPTTVVSLLPSGLPSRTIFRTVSSKLLGFCFCFSLFFVSVPCAR